MRKRFLETSSMLLQQKKRSVFANDRLRVSVTDTCMLRCTYCSNEGQHHNKKNFLNPKWYIQFLHKLSSEGVYIRKLNITGGEPLLHPQLKTILSASVCVADEVTLNTNGLLLNRSKIDEFASLGVTNIKFGVDWLFGVATKPSRNSPKYSQVQFIDLITHAIKVMPRSSLNIVVSKFNSKRISKMISFVIDKNIDKVEFLEIIEHDFRKNLNPSVRVIKAKDMVEKLSSKFERIEYNAKLAKYMCFMDNGLMLQFAEDFCNRSVCQNLWTRMDARGHIAPCIKGHDSYSIDIEKELFGQLIGMNRLMCNRCTGHFPRTTSGKLLLYSSRKNRNPNCEDFLQNDFVTISDRDP